MNLDLLENIHCLGTNGSRTHVPPFGEIFELESVFHFQAGTEQVEPAVHGRRARRAGGDGAAAPGHDPGDGAGHVRLEEERLPRRAARLTRQGEHHLPQPAAVQGD